MKKVNMVVYLFEEGIEKELAGSLSMSADRDGAFPFCAAIDSRTHFTSLSLLFTRILIVLNGVEAEYVSRSRLDEYMILRVVC